MAWSDANTGRRQNITALLGNISRTASEAANRREQAKSRRWNMFGDLANMGLDVWGTLSGRKYETGERLAGEAHENTQRILTSESNQELENLRALNDKKLEQYKQNLANAKTEDERKYWQDVIRPYETEQEELDRKSREDAAAAGRSSQNIYSGQADQFKLLGDIWNATVEDNIAQHSEWLQKDPDTGETIGYNLPQEIYDAILSQAGLAGIPEEIAKAYIAARNIKTKSKTELGPDTSGLTGNKKWGTSTPAMSMLSPEQQNIIQKLQSAAGRSQSLQVQQDAQNMILDIQNNPQNYQAGSVGLSKALSLIDKMIKQYAPSTMTEMPRYGAFGLKD